MHRLPHPAWSLPLRQPRERATGLLARPGIHHEQRRGDPGTAGEPAGSAGVGEGRRNLRRYPTGRRSGRDGGDHRRRRQADGHHPARHRDRDLGGDRAVEPSSGSAQQGLAGPVPAEPGDVHAVPPHRAGRRGMDVLRPTDQARPGLRHRPSAELRDRRRRPEDHDRRAVRGIQGHGHRPRRPTDRRRLPAAGRRHLYAGARRADHHRVRLRPGQHHLRRGLLQHVVDDRRPDPGVPAVRGRRLHRPLLPEKPRGDDRESTRRPVLRRLPGRRQRGCGRGDRQALDCLRDQSAGHAGHPAEGIRPAQPDGCLGVELQRGVGLALPGFRSRRHGQLRSGLRGLLQPGLWDGQAVVALPARPGEIQLPRRPDRRHHVERGRIGLRVARP